MTAGGLSGAFVTALARRSPRPGGDADLDFAHLGEILEGLQPAQQLGRTEVKARGPRGVLGVDDETFGVDVGDHVVAGFVRRQEGAQLVGPRGALLGPGDETPQRGTAWLAIVEDLVYGSGSHVRTRCFG